MVHIRNCNADLDKAHLQALERSCEVGGDGTGSVLQDTLGDPTCGVSNTAMSTVLVAELNGELVGVIQGTLKRVKTMDQSALVGYILGLRVSPCHRRIQIGYGLVREMESWLVDNDAQYAYMATEITNEASFKLFTEKLNYTRFCAPSILVNPVSYCPTRLSSSVEFVQLKRDHDEQLYKRFMGESEFFPEEEIGDILRNKLSLGTWIAYRKKGGSGKDFDFNKSFPTSWAMLSVWNTGELFKLRVVNPSLGCLTEARCKSLFSCFRLPCRLPDVFNPFGFYFMFGLHQEGPKAGSLMRSLCQLVHNMGVKDEDCRMVVTEVGDSDPSRPHIPHSKRLSFEDCWCFKDLMSTKEPTRIPHPRSLFVYPREV